MLWDMKNEDDSRKHKQRQIVYNTDIYLDILDGEKNLHLRILSMKKLYGAILPYHIKLHKCDIDCKERMIVGMMQGNYIVELSTTMKVSFSPVQNIVYNRNHQVNRRSLEILETIIYRPVVILPPLPICPEPPPSRVLNEITVTVITCYNLISSTTVGQKFINESRNYSVILQHSTTLDGCYIPSSNKYCIFYIPRKHRAASYARAQ